VIEMQRDAHLNAAIGVSITGVRRIFCGWTNPSLPGNPGFTQRKERLTMACFNRGMAPGKV
jgi:hypothetical protein